MQSGRLYTMSISNVSVSATQALFTIYGGAKIVSLRSINLGQTTFTGLQLLAIRIVYLPVTVTAGSGGSAGTINNWDSGDAAVTATGRINDTTKPVSSGTAVNLWCDVWNITNGFIWIPPCMMEPPMCNTSEAIMITLDTAPSSAMNVQGSVVFEECV